MKLIKCEIKNTLVYFTIAKDNITVTSSAALNEHYISKKIILQIDNLNPGIIEEFMYNLKELKDLINQELKTLQGV